MVIRIAWLASALLVSLVFTDNLIAENAVAEDAVAEKNAVAETQAPADPEIPPLLPDQHGEMGGLQNQPQALQMVIVVSAKRLRRLKPWERELRERYPDLGLLRVADVPVSSPTPVEEVAAKLRKRLPADVDVLIDLDGIWAGHYNLDISVPNLLLFDSGRSLIAQHAGFYKRQRFEAMAVDIDQAIADTAAGVSASTEAAAP